VRTTADLRQLGPTDLGALRERSVRDFIPRAFHRRLSRFIIGETAGTSGRPCTTAYRKDEFEAAFIDPFLRVAEAARFPRNAPWLWVGPSGPHIIGKVVRELACRMGNIDPFSVDFDPRWAKRLTAGSLGRQRYLDHVIAQATDILEREEIGVIFTTPPTLTALAQALTDRQREYVQGVHYGGLSVTPEAVNEFRRMFPNAVHLSGYGNTLFGVVMEAMDEPRTAMDYFPLGDRLLFEVVRGADDWPMEPSQLGERGRVMFHRFDESALLVNVVERDEAELVPVSPQARRLGGRQPGIRNPKAPAALENRLQHGLY
jgi:phenylacetate-coenzyme A ligase PaaK-like adenylate-forming protein